MIKKYSPPQIRWTEKYKYFIYYNADYCIPGSFWSRKLKDGRVIRFCCPENAKFNRRTKKCSDLVHLSTLVPLSMARTYVPKSRSKKEPKFRKCIEFYKSGPKKGKCKKYGKIGQQRIDRRWK